MLNKAALFIFTAVTLVSIAAYAEDESKDNNVLACKDCLLADSEEDSEKPLHWII